MMKEAAVEMDASEVDEIRAWAKTQDEWPRGVTKESAALLRLCDDWREWCKHDAIMQPLVKACAGMLYARYSSWHRFAEEGEQCPQDMQEARDALKAVGVTMEFEHDLGPVS